MELITKNQAILAVTTYGNRVMQAFTDMNDLIPDAVHAQLSQALVDTVNEIGALPQTRQPYQVCCITGMPADCYTNGVRVSVHSIDDAAEDIAREIYSDILGMEMPEDADPLDTLLGYFGADTMTVEIA